MSIHTQIVLEDSEGEPGLMEYEVSGSSGHQVIPKDDGAEKRSFHTIRDPARPAPPVFVINRAPPVLAQPVGIGGDDAPDTPPLYFGFSLHSNFVCGCQFPKVTHSHPVAISLRVILYISIYISISIYI